MLAQPEPLRGAARLRPDRGGPVDWSAGAHWIMQVVGQRLWWQWLMVSLVAGGGIEIIYQSLPRPSLTNLIATSFLRLLAIYVIVSILQSIVLRHSLKFWIGWAAASVAGIVVAAAVLAVFGVDIATLGFYAAMMQFMIGPWTLMIVLGGTVFLAVASTGQAYVLARAGARRTAWWVLTGLGGVGGGLMVGMYWPLPFLGPFGTFGLVSGAVTATVISWLLPRDLAPAQPDEGHA